MCFCKSVSATYSLNVVQYKKPKANLLLKHTSERFLNVANEPIPKSFSELHSKKSTVKHILLICQSNCKLVFLLAGPFLLPHIPCEGRGGGSILLVH